MTPVPDASSAWWTPDTDGQTPLDPDESSGLKLAFITTRGDLNAAEGTNIATGIQWAESQVRGGAHVASEEFLRELHLRLFGQVWEWAGSYRRTERNIGIDPLQIPIAMADLSLAAQGIAPFSWGANTGLTAPETRQRYLTAVRAADDHDLAPLMAFVRS